MDDGERFIKRSFKNYKPSIIVRLINSRKLKG